MYLYEHSATVYSATYTAVLLHIRTYSAIYIYEYIHIYVYTIHI